MMGDIERPVQPIDNKPLDFVRSDPLVRALAGFDGFRFDPVALIKATNFFYGLGFSESLLSLQQHSRITANPENILLIARLLYEPVDVSVTLPRLDLGHPDLEEPQPPDLIPLFPLHLVQDLPLLLVGGYLAGGEAQPPTVYLKWCAEHARLRPGPLSPGDKPLAALDAFLISTAWLQLDKKIFHAGMLRLQLLRGLPHLFRVTGKEQQAMLATSEPTPFWLAQRKKEERLNLAWNPSLYTFQPGNMANL